MNPPPLDSVILVATMVAAMNHKTGRRAVVQAPDSEMPDGSVLGGFGIGPDPPDDRISVIFIRAREQKFKKDGLLFVSADLPWTALETWVFEFPRAQFVDDSLKPKGGTDA